MLGKCKGMLLQDLAHQMKQLKEDLENRKGNRQIDVEVDGVSDTIELIRKCIMLYNFHFTTFMHLACVNHHHYYINLPPTSSMP